MNSKKRCKHCDQYVDASSGFQAPVGFFCSGEHAIAFAVAKNAIKSARDIKKSKKAAITKHRADKERIKPLSKLLAETQAVINRYVRLRDRNKGCVSCDKRASWRGQWHASHLHSRGKSSKLRFNLWNIHKSCSVCNNHLSGNLAQYERKVKRRIGARKLKWMESVASEPTRHDPDYLRRMKKVFSKKCRMIEKRGR